MRARTPGWDPRATERDACGAGFVADAEGRASREIVERALDALARVRHRGAVAADARTGDGAGLLTPIPRGLLAAALGPRGAALDLERLGLAMVFAFDGAPPADVRRAVEAACADEAIDVVAWRTVPVEPEALGEQALRAMPRIEQAVLGWPTGRFEEDGERACHRARRRAEAALRRDGRHVYFPSFSFSTVTYKALVAADQLARFYPDLRDPRFEGAFAIFHQRYSTNTAPTWERAQPFRLSAHNGEINTIAGNVHRMRSREGRLGLPTQAEEDLLRPIVDETGSDSAMLDDVVELLARESTLGAPRDIRQVVAMLVPAAWEGTPGLPPEVRDFYRWHATQMEPWDGPAALVFTDGSGVGAALDRGGLRPLRWAICDDGFVAAASEAGAVDVAGHGGVRRGKLGPGGMLYVDPHECGVQLDPVRRVAHRRPYGAWLREHRIVHAGGEPAGIAPVTEPARRRALHGYTREELLLSLRPSAHAGREPTFSMGDDTPPAALRAHRGTVFDHVRQRFAQVTNPAIDHLRERFVMSTRVLLGPRDPLLWERPETASVVECASFLLFRLPGGAVLDATWPVEEGPAGLRAALERLGHEAVHAARHGGGIQVVSDAGAGPARAPVPSLLAVGAVDLALLAAGHRTRTSIVVQSDDARESHHVAALLGFGAEAVLPRLAFVTIAELAEEAEGSEAVPAWLARYWTALEEGVLKALAKLGISSVDAYRGARTFDVLGLSEDAVDLCLAGAPAALGGTGLEDLAADVLARHAGAFGEATAPAPANPGLVKFHRGGEYHATNPDVVRALHGFVDPSGERLRSTVAGQDKAAVARRAGAGPGAGAGAKANGSDPYEAFARLIDARPPAAPRDLLEPAPAGPPVPLHEVEPAPAILRRFSTAAISHGSISREAHKTLALAMALVGGMSNSGEGGEDPARFRTPRNSRIKQIASGRFGVTPEYCAFADELQIKIAQGSKPGEGGHLPAHKVTDEIARLRHTRAGVTLISPAPHHDIYSIEDLAQLVFDLKQVNPRAAVSVKLVAEAGVGTIAAGVAKALADVVHIAGADGGTGASPLSSIKNAGLPWEVGLAEAQHVLAESGLRGRVRLRVDGGLKTGRDVLLAALLGADEFSFGTAVLVAEGCIMVRTCHLDTCPTGIATQRPELRSKFAGTPEMVAAYLTGVAEDVRRRLAALGLRSLDEAIGRTDLLRPRGRPGDEGGGRDAAGRAGEAGTAAAARGRLRVDELLASPAVDRRFEAPGDPVPRSALGDRLHGEAWPAVRAGRAISLAYPITNSDRAVGARLGGEIGRAFGTAAPPGSVRAEFHGQAGQSFGAFLADGVELRLVGEANDYVGKGMGGGRIVIVPPPDDLGDPVLAGNTILYGATGGELLVAGTVGERFAVRNSGALAVVEGAGDHCCEYMTGGTVVVLGPVGVNLGAGMTGGSAFVLDPLGALAGRVNPELVEVGVLDAAELARLRDLVELHAMLTGSPRARDILDRWELAAAAFRLVSPRGDARTTTRRPEEALALTP